MISQSMQDYLKAIYKLQKGQAATEAVTTSLVSEKMDVVPASATNMIKKLAELRLVHYTPYRGVGLTDAGERVALEIIRHHRLLELYLKETLGYSWDSVDAEAEQLEHVISEEFEERIDATLGHPTVGVHGEPIPSKEGEIEQVDYLRLTQLQVGQKAVIRQVSDRNPDMLRYMETLGLRPEVRVEVWEKNPFNGPLVLKIDSDKEQVLGLGVADHIYVTVT